MTQTWNVTYLISGNDTPWNAKVSLREGYSTMNDIPKIISIKRGVEESEIVLMAMIRVFNN